MWNRKEGLIVFQVSIILKRCANPIHCVKRLFISASVSPLALDKPVHVVTGCVFCAMSFVAVRASVAVSIDAVWCFVCALANHFFAKVTGEARLAFAP